MRDGRSAGRRKVGRAGAANNTAATDAGTTRAAPPVSPTSDDDRHSLSTDGGGDGDVPGCNVIVNYLPTSLTKRDVVVRSGVLVT